MSIVRVNEFNAAVKKSAEFYTFSQALVPYITAAKDCIESYQLAITNYPQEEVQAAMSLG
jgi:hypothetical protein